MNQANAYTETSQKCEEKYVNSGTDVENVLQPQPLEDAVKVGEKRKSEEKETEDNRGENTTYDQVNDSKRLKTDIVVDREKFVKKVILEWFHVPEQEKKYYEDKTINEVFVEIFMKQVTQPNFNDNYLKQFTEPNFKDYLKSILTYGPEQYKRYHSQLLYMVHTAIEVHRRASDKGDLSELFNQSYVTGCIYMAVSQALSRDFSTKISTKIDTTVESLCSLGGQNVTGDKTESQPNTVWEEDDFYPAIEKADNVIQSFCSLGGQNVTGNVTDHTVDRSNDN